MWTEFTSLWNCRNRWVATFCRILEFHPDDTFNNFADHLEQRFRMSFWSLSSVLIAPRTSFLSRLLTTDFDIIGDFDELVTYSCWLEGLWGPSLQRAARTGQYNRDRTWLLRQTACLTFSCVCVAPSCFVGVWPSWLVGFAAACSTTSKDVASRASQWKQTDLRSFSTSWRMCQMRNAQSVWTRYAQRPRRRRTTQLHASHAATRSIAIALQGLVRK